jgi:hypothetical protein
VRATMKSSPLIDSAEIKVPELRENPRYKAAAKELADLMDRRDKSVRRQRIAVARSRGQKPTGTILDRAQALVKGGEIAGFTPATETEAALEEQKILTLAICEAQEKLDAIVGEITFEVCARYADKNAENLRAALEHAAALYKALHNNSVLRGKLIGAGYAVSDPALPINLFPAGFALGNPDDESTPAGQFKSWLRVRKILRGIFP